MPLIVIGALFCFAIAAFATRGIRRVCIQHCILDLPNARSSHTSPVPRGGGLSIVATVLLGVSLLSFSGVLSTDIAAALFGGGLLVAGVGLADDVWNVPVWTRLVIHFLSAVWVLSRIGDVAVLDLGPIHWAWGWIGYFLQAICLVWMINLYNFMDGIDALAGLEATMVSACGAVLLFRHGHSDLAILALILMSTSAGFLVWNWPPARIFMGDAGSGFLGFTFGVLTIACSKRQATFGWMWLILLAVFIVDATFTLALRVIGGEVWYAPHRSHGYQVLSRLWRSHKKVTLAVAVINLIWLFPLAWLATTSVNNAPWYAFVAFFSMMAVRLGAPHLATHTRSVGIIAFRSHVQH